MLSVPSAEAVTLCAKRSGRLVTREACKKRETAAIPGAITIVGPTGPQGAAGPAGAAAIIPHEVVDATGKQFGTLLSWQGGRAQVIATVPDVDVPLQFNIEEGDFFNLPAQESVLYPAAGCSGAPFIRDAGGLVPMALVFGTRAYFSRTLLSQQAVASREFRPSTPGDCGVGATDTGRQTCCTDVATFMDDLSPAETFEVSVLGVTPPFTVVPR